MMLDDSEKKCTLEGTIERIVFYNDDNHYIVARFKEGEKGALVTVVGNIMNANPGEMFRLEGEWIVDKRFGEQFRIERFESILPASTKGIEKFLGSGLIKGIGPTYAKRLVKRFGEKTLDILDNDMERICEVPGIGEKRLGKIRDAWVEYKNVRDVLICLQGYDISTTYALKIHRMYGSRSVRVVEENPYRLALDIPGIGFRKADVIAGNIGIDKNSPLRAAAGVLHFLNEMVSSEGHTFYPYDDLVAHARNMLEIDEGIIKDAIDRLVEDKRLVLENLPEGEHAAFPKKLHVAETNAALLIGRLIATGKVLPRVDGEVELDLFEKENNFALADRQRLALLTALQGGVMVITGGPGTGKTTIVNALMSILSKKKAIVVLAAPTGRAAKRLTETTGRRAATIHRLLKWNPSERKFKKNADNPLKADMVIVDESSMIDIMLAYHLLKAIAPTTSVVFVGDVDQLPSVGPGNFLKDLIGSEKIPVVELNEIFRQSKQSLIVYNAHRVNKGEFPYLKPPEGGKTTDFYFIERSSPEDILETIKNVIVERIPARFKLDPFRDVQVITPMHKGIIGTTNLNIELQELLNKNENYVMRGATKFKVGDKVMQIKNNYDKDIYNGDIGVIVSLDRINHLIRINYEGRTIDYDYSDLDEITLAYATSVHKAQGSEFKAVILPIHTQHYVLLQRNLIYTAITRGKRLVVLVGTRKALSIAIRNDKNQIRYSGLKQRLLYGVEGGKR